MPEKHVMGGPPRRCGECAPGAYLDHSRRVCEIAHTRREQRALARQGWSPGAPVRAAPDRPKAANSPAYETGITLYTCEASEMV